MPQFWQKSFTRSSPRPANGSSFYAEGSQQHPETEINGGSRTPLLTTTIIEHYYFAQAKSLHLSHFLIASTRITYIYKH
ncbi:hypothetical protein MRB53_041238 [Persea americana]|nr:hypothetical protein MRB53_041238 [Persea americana]